MFSYRFRRASTQPLIQVLKEEEADLEENNRIEVQIGGEGLTPKQTDWEIQ